VPVVPLIALAILILGFSTAAKSRRPRISIVLTLVAVLIVACFWPPVLAFRLPSWVLPAVTLVLALFVLPEASTFDDPGEFRVGVVMVATAIASFWPLQAWVAHLELGFWEYTIALHVAALLLSACLFLSGVFYLWSAVGSAQRHLEAPPCPQCAGREVRVTLRSVDGVYCYCETCEHLWIVPKQSRAQR
jgi:hypothetical protein